MALILPVAIIGVALAALVLTPASTPILGLSHTGFAGAALGVALLAFWAPSALGGLRLRGAFRVIASAAIWGFMIVALTDLYSYRQDLVDIGARMVEDLLPSEPTIGQGGEVVINSRFSGGFYVPAKVDGRPVKFVFDTGATTVVLTAEDAKRVGVDLDQLDFSAPVATANGSALAAPVRLDQVAVGPIVIRNVRALVARPGAMRESLLGMSFLQRLDSFGVERGRLVIRAK